MIIFLIRHAKTQYPSLGMDDFDRALIESGKQEAARVSAKLVARGIKPDIIISSPAKRAKMTAEIFDGSGNGVGIVYSNMLRIDKNGNRIVFKSPHLRPQDEMLYPRGLKYFFKNNWCELEC